MTMPAFDIHTPAPTSLSFGPTSAASAAWKRGTVCVNTVLGNSIVALVERRMR
jgi:hypothetical protein